MAPQFLRILAVVGKFPHHVKGMRLRHDGRMARTLTDLGRVSWRDDKRAFGIHAADRLAHMYVVGKTGTGKSSFLESLARQDIVNGHGLALFDPHGDLVERVHGWALSNGRRDVIYLDVPRPVTALRFQPAGERAAAPAIIAFRVGAQDAQTLVKEFAPEFEIDDLISLPNRQFCVRMLVKGEFARSFSGRTLDVRAPKATRVA